MARPTSKWAAATLLAFAIQGCASLPPGTLRDPGDPFERYNRAAFSFNDTMDRAVLRPVAVAYRTVAPDPLRQAISNFFDNLSDVPTIANDLLQGKLKMAATHTGRVALNSTFGLLGVMDLATPMGLERQREDFGLTLGAWGLAGGPYLVLPLLGPSSVRDTAGLGVDLAIDPVLRLRDFYVRDAADGLRIENQRSELLGIEKTLRAIELNPYVFTRDTYLARRRNAVDGDNLSEHTTASESADPAP